MARKWNVSTWVGPNNIGVTILNVIPTVFEQLRLDFPIDAGPTARKWRREVAFCQYGCVACVT